MAKRLNDFLVPRPKDKMPVNARIEKELVLAARKALKQDQMSWTDLIRASIQLYLEERGSKE